MDKNINFTQDKILYKVENLVYGTFISRPNRYIAEVEINGEIEIVHVHDPGRLKELLFKGNSCIVRPVESTKRKTKWDMIAAQKEDEYILIHSGIHRYLAEAILRHTELSPFGAWAHLKAEVKACHSRFDFKLSNDSGEMIWIEVKGCSLSEMGVAKFPDAPTTRGVRHLEELIQLKKQGDRTGVMILILSRAKIFAPNTQTDPKFSEVFYQAKNLGVELHPIRIEFQPETGNFYFMNEIAIKESH